MILHNNTYSGFMKSEIQEEVKSLDQYWTDRVYKPTPAPMPAKENNEMTALLFGERLLTTAYSFMISTFDRRQVCLLHHGRCIITFWPCHDWTGKKKKHHWHSSENPITLWNLVHPFEDLCIKMHYHCCNNCLYYILTVMCAP